MIKAIVTRQNKDGTFDEVGMNNRTIVQAKGRNHILKTAREYGSGRKCRIEMFFCNGFYGNPFEIVFI
jgi:hypothetical protein